MDKSDTVERFQQRLRSVIHDSELTQSAFAARVGIDRSTLSQILSSGSQRLPRVETLAAIARDAQVSLDWLVGLSNVDERANLLREAIELAPGGDTPVDERLAAWHAEAKGYKIRHVPASLPDMLKTAELIEYEYAGSPGTTPEQRIELSSFRLQYQRLPETDMEVCSSLQSLQTFARGEGIWRGLPRDVRIRQLQNMVELCDELYPRYRWFLFDGLKRYSVPLTIFGPLRVAIYLGHMYLNLTGREHIEQLIGHFDRLIRDAAINPPEVVPFLRELIEETSR